jgi:hypothetical protein
MPVSPYRGMQMKHLVASHLGPVSTGSASRPEPSTLSPRESARDYRISRNMPARFFQGLRKWGTVLPKDEGSKQIATGNDYNAQIAKAQSARQAEFMRQARMDWLNHFMVTKTDKQRENNIAMAAFVKQRQLSPPSTYGQFYAFMHALSAAFGNLSQGQ